MMQYIKSLVSLQLSRLILVSANLAHGATWGACSGLEGHFRSVPRAAQVSSHPLLPCCTLLHALTCIFAGSASLKQRSGVPSAASPQWFLCVTG
jgi:hypothetical protein